MNTLYRFFAWDDRRRARDVLQDFCDDRVKALRALDKANRQAARATREASKLDTEHFRVNFFGGRDPVHAGFMAGSAALFGITEPTPFVVKVQSLDEIGPTRYSVARQFFCDSVGGAK